MDFKNLIIECLGLQDVTIESYATDKENLSLNLTVRQNFINDDAETRCLG